MKTAVLRTTRLPSAPRPAASSFQIPLHAIAGENRIRSVPNRSSADCITNTSSRLPVRD